MGFIDWLGPPLTHSSLLNGNTHTTTGRSGIDSMIQLLPMES
jgi:hypothetical protein